MAIESVRPFGAEMESTLRELLGEECVAGILREYFAGELAAIRARRALLDATIAHVRALDLVDKFEAQSIGGPR